MKKFILAITLIVASFGLSAQTYSPYGNAGVSVGSDVLSYNGELGVESAKARFALAGKSATNSPENIWSVGPKAYFKFAGDSKFDYLAYGSLLMDLHRGHALTFEPGVAASFGAYGLRPQIHVGFPIRENEVLRSRRLGMSAGVSLNF